MFNKSQQEFDSDSSSSSLIAKAGQIMAIIIAFSLISMIASMLVSENLSGDAAKINQAGALRMHAMRISRANFLDKRQLKSEIQSFEKKLNQLFPGGLTNLNENIDIQSQYLKIHNLWQKLNTSEFTPSITRYDRFVTVIDELVTILQLESEKKLSFLRSIQGIGLLSTLIISFIVLFRLNRSIILPLKQLVEVAEEAGKGNFDLKSEYIGNDELGVLAGTINQMSDELKTTYQDFEQRVDDKTIELTRSNRSLEVLYHAANSLASNEYHQTDQQIVDQLEAVLGSGKVSIEKLQQAQDTKNIDITITENKADQLCFQRLEYPLEKQTVLFGHLVWQLPKQEHAKDWQNQMLQTMADIIATALELERKRNLDDRLLIVEERAVIARELHDSLAQSLSYLKVQMSLLTRKMQKKVAEEQINETIEDIKHGLNSAYRQLRELLTTFRLKLEDPSLEKALQGTVAEFSAKCEHPIKLDFQLPQNFLSANQEIHVLQIVREAFSNVHRHANANNAGVSLIAEENRVKVKIWDDGQGLTSNEHQHGHFGLGIMEERAKSLNTLIELKSGEQHGTHVIFEFEQ